MSWQQIVVWTAAIMFALNAKTIGGWLGSRWRQRRQRPMTEREHFRSIWNIIHETWRDERWIRVNDKMEADRDEE